MTKKWRTSDFVKLRSLYRKGLKLEEIAKILKSTKSTVGAYIGDEIIQGRLKKRGSKTIKKESKKNKEFIDFLKYIENEFPIKESENHYLLIDIRRKIKELESGR